MDESRDWCSRQGWFAVLCLHITWVACSGIIDGLGVMLPTLKTQLDAETWLMGWMVSIVCATASFVGILSSPLEFIFGIRPVLVVSGFMMGASLIFGALVTNTLQLTLILSLIGAPGLSFTIILTRALVGRHFTTSYGLANAIGSSGYALGFIVIGPFTQLLLDTYGWRGTMLILGGFTLNVGACCGLLRPPPSEMEPEADGLANAKYAPLSNIDEEVETDERSAEGPADQSRLRSAVDVVMKRFRFSICYQASFWFPAFVNDIYRVVPRLWLIHLVSMAESRGFSAYGAVAFVSISGLGNFVGKLAFGILVDRGLMSLRWAIALSIVLSALPLMLNPWAISYWLLMAFAFIFCIGSGSVSSLCDLYTKELLGGDNLVAAFSLMEIIAGILQFIIGFYPGWMYDQTGSYDLAYVILGFISATPLLAIILESWLMRKKCNAQTI